MEYRVDWMYKHKDLGTNIQGLEDWSVHSHLHLHTYFLMHNAQHTQDTKDIDGVCICKYMPNVDA